MKPLIPTSRLSDNVPTPDQAPVPPVLEPIKPVAQKPASRPEQVMLGTKPARYDNIEALMAKPAYQTRNSKFIVQMPAGRKEVLKDEKPDKTPQQETPKGGSLFD